MSALFSLRYPCACYGARRNAPVRGRAHRLAELAVVGNVDAGVFLHAHDSTNGRAQPRLERSFVSAVAAFFARLARKPAGCRRLPTWVVRIRSVLRS